MNIQTDIAVGPFEYGPAGNIMLSRYVETGNVAIVVNDGTGERILKASVLPHDFALAPDEVAIKDWSENEGVEAALLAAGVIEPTGRLAPCGHVAAGIYRLAGPLLPWLEKLPTIAEYQGAAD